MRILGIDPGLARIGFGVIDERNGEFALVEYGTILTCKTGSFLERLDQIRRELQTVIARSEPEQCAIEKLFFAKNVKTAMDVAQARGAIAMCVAQAGIPAWEYAPLEVKKSLVGYGRADKDQIGYMVRTILGLDFDIESPDAADALALAVCHSNSFKMKRIIQEQ